MRPNDSLRAAAAAVVVATVAAGPAVAGDLVLRRAELTQAGVGTFEYEARVDGAATLGLDLPRDQVSDALRSLVVRDPAGAVRSVTLPGESGAEAAFADLPVPRDSLARPLDLLNALRGVPLTVEGATPLAGRLLAAEPEPVPTPPGAPPQPARTRVTLLGEPGLQQFVLEDAAAVQIADADLRARLAAALDRSRGSAASERRHLAIALEGTGERSVGVSLVLPSPLWKASYRLVLPAEGANTARLQGWAILENDGAADWSGVQVTLQAGNLVAFRQDVYARVDVSRADVPVDLAAHPVATEDSGALGKALATDGAALRRMLLPAPALAPAPEAVSASAPAATALARPAEAAVAGGTPIAATFTLPRPLDLPAGQTASEPFLDRDLPARALGLLRPSARHPLAGLALTNDTGSALPAGAVTTLGASGFAGDARLAAFPAGERRILTFAEDPTVTADWDSGEATVVTGVSAVRGVARITRRARQTTTVALAASGTAPAHLVVEVPRSAGTTLTTEPEDLPVEATTSTWRIDVDLPPGPPLRVRAFADRTLAETVTIGPDGGEVAALLDNADLPVTARAALARVADLRAEASRRDAARDRAESERTSLLDEETRIRANLAALAPNDALRGRLVRALEAAEDALAGSAKRLADARGQADAAHDALADAVATLQF